MTYDFIPMILVIFILLYGVFNFFLLLVAHPFVVLAALLLIYILVTKVG